MQNFLILNNFLSFCDAPEAWQIGTQDPATPIMEGMISFHNYLVFYIIFIGVAVCWLLYKIIINFNSTVNKKADQFNHSSILEIIWTIIPAVILVFIAVPSFALLYSLDEVIDPEVTLKIVGHQWYWSYEYSDPNPKAFNLNTDDNSIAFDSYMITTDELEFGSFRLLETDNRIILPINTHIRLLITAADVIHSWAIPSFGVKLDACPGRLSQASLFIKRPGYFYGQCSEICGVNHAFMPIVVEATDREFYQNWVNNKLNSN